MQGGRLDAPGGQPLLWDLTLPPSGVEMVAGDEATVGIGATLNADNVRASFPDDCVKYVPNRTRRRSLETHKPPLECPGSQQAKQLGLSLRSRRWFEGTYNDCSHDAGAEVLAPEGALELIGPQRRDAGG